MVMFHDLPGLLPRHSFANVVGALTSGSVAPMVPSQMQAAQRTLSELQERIAGEDAAGALNWFRVDQILESAVATANTRFYALQILESAIKYRWKTLPPEQQASGPFQPPGSHTCTETAVHANGVGKGRERGHAGCH
jgi:hypothetical protein